MFALYLDIQKQIDIDTLDETEVKGRWKSFVSKWYESILPRHRQRAGRRLTWQEPRRPR